MRLDWKGAGVAVRKTGAFWGQSFFWRRAHKGHLIVLGQLVRLWLVLGQIWHDKAGAVGDHAVFEQRAVVAIVALLPLLRGARQLTARLAPLALRSVTSAAGGRGIRGGKVPESNAGGA